MSISIIVTLSEITSIQTVLQAIQLHQTQYPQMHLIWDVGDDFLFERLLHKTHLHKKKIGALSLLRDAPNIFSKYML